MAVGGDDGARDPDGAGPSGFRLRLDNIRTTGQKNGTAVTQVQSAGYDPLPKSGRAGPGADMIKNRGSQAAMKPTFIAAVLRQGLEQGPSDHGSILAGHQLNPGVKGAEKTKGFIAQIEDPRRTTWQSRRSRSPQRVRAAALSTLRVPSSCSGSVKPSSLRFRMARLLAFNSTGRVAS